MLKAQGTSACTLLLASLILQQGPSMEMARRRTLQSEH
jgi:hypothetical protein